jgi:hypothetical protein
LADGSVVGVDVGVAMGASERRRRWLGGGVWSGKVDFLRRWRGCGHHPQKWAIGRRRSWCWRGVSITLRGGLPVGGGGGDVGTALSVVVAVQMPVSNSVRFCKAVTWLSVRGAKDAAGDGWRRAVVMSCSAARIRLLEEARGMATFVGNHETVSEIRSARISSIQMV